MVRFLFYSSLRNILFFNFMKRLGYTYSAECEQGKTLYIGA